MQISERFRRGVVVPLDETSVRSMADGVVDESTRVHFVEISTQAEFESIWRAGIFDEINKQLGTIMHDYEEEIVPVEMTPRLRAIVKSYSKMLISYSANGFFAALLEACDFAFRSGMALYFIL